ncbi:putative MFS myo-inositol transporter [Aureobasidium pullulans]|uniref:MFS myo-inositol transporter n=1 Tax=Aureobasidium pullulans TaxID=5580 RepID=A0A4S9V921_AURPU|nr:putative MFS myo-inositol transporter [Aureobasidium pullulans]THZ47487.1 putative MFS myo-inositol transporter [Aureobasidium pullulans]THZ62501.1 putative MFS myo-inositol transporter [Aureobasidium pullulans]THZ98695.1 putative MFS myo-inositol transporter [Aureobasidium pullulans]
MANEKLSYDRKSAGPEGETDRIDVKDERSSGSASPEPSHEATLWERQRDPYLGKSERDVSTDLESLVQQYDLHDLKEELARGARYAYNRDDTDRLNPTEDERHWIAKEKSPAFKDKWAQTKMMYFVAFLCGSAAIVQGMDQTAVNGAQLGYFEDFNITNEWEQGLINGAPYLCSVLIGCWTSPVLNKYFGRRGTIWISCFVSIASGAWQGATFDKWQLFASRFVGGFAIGAKSSTTPAYAAECSPPRIRGALGSQWQMWTAFGIMLGFIASVAFYGIEVEGYPGLDWRLMLASTSIPPIFVCCMTFFAPESPRWLMSKGRYREAFQSLCRLRQCHLHAARDLYDIHIRLMLEHELKPKTAWARATKLFSVPRNRRAAQSAFFVMLMQQFCGVNVIAYYSSAIFVDAGFTVQRALLASMGTGIINWLFAIPGILTIDTKGRRWLLLVTFPYMAACLFFTGFSFFIPEDRGDARIACVATGIYLFMVGYSPGMGPVPFTYSAESFPLAVRDTGMAFATATCWGFNFILALTWPALQTAFTTQGAFCWYAAWNLFGFVFTWFCLPETKARPLEELDAVFNIRTRDHFAYHLIKTPVIGKRHVGNNLADVAAVIEGRDVKGHV